MNVDERRREWLLALKIGIVSGPGVERVVGHGTQRETQASVNHVGVNACFDRLGPGCPLTRSPRTTITGIAPPVTHLSSPPRSDCERTGAPARKPRGARRQR